MATPSVQANRPADSRRTGNVRVALILSSIALVFFGGVIFAHLQGEADVGIAVLGTAIFGFLLLTVGRAIWRGSRG